MDISTDLGDWFHTSEIIPDVMSDLFTKVVKAKLGVEVVLEHRFAPPRKWRFDYALVEQRIAVEVEGGVWTRGRHTRGAGFLKDVEKYNEAAVRGWIVIRTTPDKLVSAETLELVERALQARAA